VAVFALGCFWGAEREFWQIPGVYTTAVRLPPAASPRIRPTEKCVPAGPDMPRQFSSSSTIEGELRTTSAGFLRGPRPYSGMRQGNDIGTQYRSAIFTYSDDQLSAAKTVRDRFQAALNRAGYGEITTQITEAGPSTTPRTITSSTWRRTRRLLRARGHGSLLRRRRDHKQSRKDRGRGRLMGLRIVTRRALEPRPARCHGSRFVTSEFPSRGLHIVSSLRQPNDRSAGPQVLGASQRSYQARTRTRMSAWWPALPHAMRLAR